MHTKRNFWPVGKQFSLPRCGQKVYLCLLLWRNAEPVVAPWCVRTVAQVEVDRVLGGDKPGIGM